MKAKRSKNVKYYHEAGAMYRKAIQLSPGYVAILSIDSGMPLHPSLALSGELNWLGEWYSTLSDEALAVLIEVLSGRERTVFDAAKCASADLITDEVVRAVAKNLPTIRTLRVRKCTKLTDDSFALVAKFCKELVELDINGTLSSDSLFPANIGPIFPL